jgi:hypothetical protein
MTKLSANLRISRKLALLVSTGIVGGPCRGDLAAGADHVWSSAVELSGVAESLKATAVLFHV